MSRYIIQHTRSRLFYDRESSSGFTSDPRQATRVTWEQGVYLTFSDERIIAAPIHPADAQAWNNEITTRAEAEA